MRNPIQLLKGAVAIVKGNPSLYIGILIIPALLSALSAFFEPAQDVGVTSTAEWLTFSVPALISTIANIIMGIALILAFEGRSLSAKDAYLSSLPLFWRYVGLSILSGIIIMIGFILLIIPGVLLSVWLAFAAFILVLERASIVESLKRSREYVRGKWWGVFGRLVACTVVAMLVVALLSIIVGTLPFGLLIENVILTILVTMLLTPVMFGYVYLMYKDLAGVGVAEVISPVAGTIAGDNTTGSSSIV